MNVLFSLTNISGEQQQQLKTLTVYYRGGPCQNIPVFQSFFSLQCV